MTALEALANAYQEARAADPRVIAKIRISPETAKRINDEEARLEMERSFWGGPKPQANPRIAAMYGVPVEVAPVAETEFVR